MISVVLNSAEMARTEEIATRRMNESIRQGLKDKAGCKRNLPGDILGCRGELALAKALGEEWDESVNTFKNPDVGDVQVRATELDRGSLIIRPNDPDDHMYVLVTGVAPNFIVRGYIYGKDAKHAKFVRSPNGREPAYFVPQSALTEIE